MKFIIRDCYSKHLQQSVFQFNFYGFIEDFAYKQNPSKVYFCKLKVIKYDYLQKAIQYFAIFEDV